MKTLLYIILLVVHPPVKHSANPHLYGVDLCRTHSDSVATWMYNTNGNLPYPFECTVEDTLNYFNGKE